MVNFPALDVSDPDEERMWLVLYDEDYDDVMLDGEDNVALLLDAEQAREVRRLADEIADEVEENTSLEDFDDE